jgi:predicted RNase H-like nuclease
VTLLLPRFAGANQPLAGRNWHTVSMQTRRQNPLLHIGVDGCAGGWFAVALSPTGDYETTVFGSFRELFGRYEHAQRMLIDIPIGLPGTQPRHCDTAARRQLAPARRSSVFPVPVREAVFAPDYATACERNFKAIGKRLTLQSWNICPKIRQVDAVLTATPAAAEWILESHPELCFAALAGRRRLDEGKKTSAGRAQRLAILQSLWARAPEVYDTALARFPRKQVARDDVLDALVLAISAQCRLRTASAKTPRDARGLPMQILFPY